jgi:hypothetical protein
MSTVKKQIGDQVMITAGQFKNRAGKLITKNRGGWTVELEDGQQVSTSFAMVALIPVTDGQETNEEQQAESTVEGSTTEDNAPTGDSDSSSQVKEQSNNADQEGDSPDVTKMTVKQLQALAKQRGIGIARTKPDFLRIIKEKCPDDDLDQLVGKVLFNRVSELHISRLRTKNDLVRMLSA